MTAQGGRRTYRPKHPAQQKILQPKKDNLNMLKVYLAILEKQKHHHATSNVMEFSYETESYVSKTKYGKDQVR